MVGAKPEQTLEMGGGEGCAGGAIFHLMYRVAIGRQWGIDSPQVHFWWMVLWGVVV